MYIIIIIFIFHTKFISIRLLLTFLVSRLSINSQPILLCGTTWIWLTFNSRKSFLVGKIDS